MDYGNGHSSEFFAIFLGVYFAILGFIFLIAIVFYVLDGFAFMKLYRKLGVEPWAAWVPIFNRWRLLEIGGQQGWISLLSLISIGSTVAAVFECIAAYKIGVAFRKDGAWVVLFIFLPFVWAWQLAAENEVYEPDLIRQAGYAPPLIGYGSVRGPYVPPVPASPPAAA